MTLTPRILALVAAAVLAAVALGGWFGLVSPERSKAHSLGAQIASERARLTVAQLVARSAKKPGKPKSTGIGQLDRAMPTSLQMPGVLRQVQRLASASHVSLDSFTPSASTPAANYDSVPIDLSVTGRYASVQSFLHGLRVQAGASDGRVHASGRLFDVQTVDLTPGADTPSQLTAAITLATFVYTGAPLPTADTTTTGTGTTASDTSTGETP
jgi:Tfp pilus assembly protein PilO